MSLTWASLRAWGGSQQTAFEELCCQLARSETPTNARFARKGSPDAGVECFAVLPDGGEWGWQAKFFERSLTQAQWRQLDKSIESALRAHPKLVRYFVCVPRDRSDGRRANVKTEMQRWDEHVAKWSSWAVDRGMDVKFVWWGSSELWERLSLSEHAGRLAFWFGNLDLFADSWFRERLAEAVTSAGTRYSPKLHVDLPIAKKFEFFGRTNAAVGSVRQLAKDVRRACSDDIRRLTTEEHSDGSPSLQPIVDACDAIVGALSDCHCPLHQQWSITNIDDEIDNTLDLIGNSREAVASAAQAYEESSREGETDHARSLNLFGSAVSALRHLEVQLWATQSELRAVEPIINSDLLIVTGEAGTGKTHLLCDVAGNRIEQQLPTVILMGQRFLSVETPWGQVLAQLDLSNSSADEFIGALEAAAQAADSRALFIIDAINEGEGDAIWPAHLSPLLKQLRRSPWIATVLSVRTPYLERVVPPEVLQSAHVLEHHGFAESTYAAVRRYCEQFDLEFPTTPLLRPEFDNPLFLKTMCEGLRSTGQRRFPVGSEGIARVFDRYLDGINTRLADLLDLDPRARTVHRALERLVERLSEKGSRWLPRNEAQLLVNELAPTGGYSRSLYRALVNTGLLMEVLPSGSDSESAVQAGFEWFADHLIAKCLVDSHETPGSLTRELVRSDADGIAAWRLLPTGLLDALAILLPERHRVELPDAFPDRPSSWSIRRSFLKTLPWRDPSTIGSRCHELVDDAFDNLDGHEWPGLADSLVTCATIPGHPIGADSFDGRLRRIPMPDRDADWSTYLHYAYGEDGPVDRLLDWAESLSAADAEVDPESARACSVVLAWFLTASNRFVRDRATKCLVALLDENFGLTAELVCRFRDVDDPYVYERLMAAAYGVALRSTDPRGMAVLAEAVYREVFSDDEPPVHFLLRDYARGVIERALHLGAAIEVDRSKIEPPYQSDWPHIPDDDELKELDATEATSPERGSDVERARRWIRTSVMDWDFARYIIGTNSSSVSSSWLSVPVHDPPWRSCDEQLEDFLDSLDSELREVFERLIERNHPRPPTICFTNQGESNNRGESDEPGFAFAVRTPFAELGLEQVVTQMLNDEQKARYDELMVLRDLGEPRLGLDLIQRYVLWRAFDLGWTIERFGHFDRYLSGRARHDTRKPERMGKKYQWIALHEILAFISDHFQYRDSYSDAQPPAAYNGPWQGYRRDIDPSCLQPAAQGQPVGHESRHSWRADPGAFDWAEDVDARDWIDRKQDLPDICRLLRFRRSDDRSTWLELHGHLTWRQPAAPADDRWETARREVWVNMAGYLVDSEAAAQVVDALRSTSVWDERPPEPVETRSLFFGEVGWSPGFQDLMSAFGSQQLRGDVGRPWCVPSFRPAAMSYAFEAGEYDCSISEPAALYRPEWRTIESMRLTWTGDGADFKNAAGELVAFDPSTRDSGPGALIIRESDFAEHLEAAGLSLIWTVIGERNAINPRRRRQWDGWLKFSGVYEYTPEGPHGHLTTQLWLPDDET